MFHNAGTSQAFKDAVHDGINSIPVPLHEALALERCSIVTGDRVTSFIPQAVGLQPAGYPAGATYDWTRGVFEESSRTIAVAAWSYNDASGQFEPNNTPQGTLRHETGHALFAVLYGVQADARFLSACAAESQSINDPGDLAMLAYYLQPGILGRRELFAEAFAIIQGGGADDLPIQIRLRQLFPRVFQAVTDIVQGI